MEEYQQERSRSRSPVRRSRSRSPVRNKNGRQRVGGRRVIVRNIPYDVKWQDLKDMFRKGIGDVTYVELLETPEGKSKGVAVVEFRDPKHAQQAVEEFHQKKIKDRAIIVREEREKDRQEFAQNKIMKERGRMGSAVGPVMGGGGGGGINMGSVGLPAGINPQILHQLGIEPPITSTVFVANLDYTVTWWKLKDVFKLAGNVIKAEIKEDKNGQSRGMGIVTFEHPMEAVQAMSMFNGQVLYDRKMIVRIDKEVEPEKPKLPSGLKSIGMGLGSGGAPLTNISQLGSSFGMVGGGAGLMGMGNLGGGVGNSGLGLLGAGGAEGFSMGGGLGGGLGSGFGGMGLDGSGSLRSAGHSGLGLGGLGGSASDLGLGGYGGSSKMGGLSDTFSNNYPGLGGSNYNSSGSLSGLGGLGPSLSSLSAGLGGMGGNSDRFSVEDALGLGRDRLGIDRLVSGLGDRMGGMGDRVGGMGDRMGGMGDRMGGLSDRMGGLNDRMGGLNDRMGGLGDRMGGLSDRMGGLGDRMGGQGDRMGGLGGLGDRMSTLDRLSEKLRDNYSGGRDDGNRRMTRPDNCTIVVKNLPYSVTWQALKEYFRDAGEVKFAEIVVENGKSTGVGYVRFGNETDAQRAISIKNRSRMERRQIDVSLHRH